MINAIRTRESVEIIKFDRLSKNQLSEISEDVNYRINEVESKFFQLYRNMMVKYALANNKRVYGFKMIQIMNR